MDELVENDLRGVAATVSGSESGSLLQVAWSKNPGGLVTLFIAARHRPGEAPSRVTWDFMADDADKLADALHAAADEARQAARRRWGS